MPIETKNPPLDLALHSEEEINKLEIQENRQRVTEVTFDTSSNVTKTFEYLQASGAADGIFTRKPLKLPDLQSTPNESLDEESPKGESLDTEDTQKHIYRIVDSGKRWTS